jgi:arylsulfatase A-like enzyme
VVIYDEYGSTRMVRTEAWKYVHRYPDGPHELYDLANDPDERANLANDSAQGARIGELQGRLEAWFARFTAPGRDGREYDVKGHGQLRPVGGRWNNGDQPFAQE